MKLPSIAQLLIPVVFSTSAHAAVILHLDAQDESSVIRTGTTVTQWNDTSGAGNDAPASGGTATYTEGVGLDRGASGVVVGSSTTSSFNPFTSLESDSFLNNSGGTGFSMFGVFKDGASNDGSWMTIAGNTNGSNTNPSTLIRFHDSLNSGINMKLNGNTGGNIGTGSIADGATIVWGVSYDGTTGERRIGMYSSAGGGLSFNSDFASSSLDTSNGNAFYVAAGSSTGGGFDGAIGEFTIYDEALSLSEFHAVLGALDDQYIFVMPEPTSMTLLFGGVAILSVMRRRVQAMTRG